MQSEVTKEARRWMERWLAQRAMARWACTSSAFLWSFQMLIFHRHKLLHLRSSCQTLLSHLESPSAVLNILKSSHVSLCIFATYPNSLLTKTKKLFLFAKNFLPLPDVVAKQTALKQKKEANWIIFDSSGESRDDKHFLYYPECYHAIVYVAYLRGKLSNIKKWTEEASGAARWMLESLSFKVRLRFFEMVKVRSRYTQIREDWEVTSKWLKLINFIVVRKLFNW